MLLLPRLSPPPADRPLRLGGGTALAGGLALTVALGLAGNGPALLGLSLVTAGLCLYCRLSLTALRRSIVLLGVLVVLAWLPALLPGETFSVWPALLASWRIVLLVLAMHALFAATTPAAVAAALDALLQRLRLPWRLQPLADEVPRAAVRLRNRLQGNLFALAARGGRHVRYPWWWVAQFPRLIARLLLECERQPPRHDPHS